MNARDVVPISLYLWGRFFQGGQFPASNSLAEEALKSVPFWSNSSFSNNPPRFCPVSSFSFSLTRQETLNLILWLKGNTFKGNCFLEGWKINARWVAWCEQQQKLFSGFRMSFDMGFCGETKSRGFVICEERLGDLPPSQWILGINYQQL